MASKFAVLESFLPPSSKVGLLWWSAVSSSSHV
jgi:hypothetical protein